MDSSAIKNMVLSPDLPFKEKALAIWDYQYACNPIYQQFIDIVRYNGFRPHNVRDIPFLPITLFKSCLIKSGKWEPALTFYSSGTTQSTRSRHLVRDAHWYLDNTTYIWENHFGPLAEYTFISLLPNYHDNPSSSLLYMVSHFMKHGKAHEERYYLDDHTSLHLHLDSLVAVGDKTVLFGVSFALLDYLEEYQHRDCKSLVVVETGGMKKHRREITREDLHMRIGKGFSGATVVSEYGMTECLSQLYCTNSNSFLTNDRMQVILTDPTDPCHILESDRRGRINIIDLANVDTLSFIATDDLGYINEDGSIDILGRIDHSDLRGCNYLI